jgi:hypothetical protein
MGADKDPLGDPIVLFGVIHVADRGVGTQLSQTMGFGIPSEKEEEPIDNSLMFAGRHRNHVINPFPDLVQSIEPMAFSFFDQLGRGVHDDGLHD